MRKLSISSSFPFVFSLPRFRFEMLEYLLCETELLRRLAALSVYLTLLRLASLRSSRSLLPFFASESPRLRFLIFFDVNISIPTMAISLISTVVSREFRALSICFATKLTILLNSSRSLGNSRTNWDNLYTQSDESTSHEPQRERKLLTSLLFSTLFI